MKNFDKKYVNLTSHYITLVMPDGLKIDIKQSGTVARVVTVDSSTSMFINGMPCISRNLTPEINGLPEPKENVYYIVSSLVYYSVGQDRKDVIAPDTKCAKTKKGKIEVKRFLIN